MLLAIDTSTALTGLACYDHTGLLGECTWQSGRNHTAHILPQLDMLMQHIQRTPADLQAIAVALGPGSWSGLRVGMSMAKGIALASNLALIGIGTLDVLAYQHQQHQQPAMPIYPLIRLGRGRFAVAKFHCANGCKRLGDYRNVSLAELAAELDEPSFFCGDIDAESQEELRGSSGAYARFAQPAANLRRPGYLAELAWRRFAAGEHDSLTGLEPIYLGEPVQKEKSGL